MSSQVSIRLSQGLYSVTEKYHINQKKRISRTFTVFAPLVLICVLAIGRILIIGFIGMILLFSLIYLLLCILATDMLLV